MAKKYQDKMIFVHLDVGDDEHEGVLEFFGVKKDQCPTFVIFEMESSSKYLAPAGQEISSDVLSTFVEDYLGGRLTKHLKTQALPADWDLHPVYTLVSSNFHSVARDRSKDVFVKFYAPWCGKLASRLLTFETLNVAPQATARPLLPSGKKLPRNSPTEPSWCLPK